MRKLVLLMMVLVSSIGCHVITEAEVKKEFASENPNAVVLSVFAGEGDGDTVYYYVKHKLLDETVLVEERQYIRNAQGIWELKTKRLQRPM